MRQTREDTISTADSADVISYLATLRMDGVGNCSIPQNEAPRGQVFWHDLSPITFVKALPTAQANV